MSRRVQIFRHAKKGNSRRITAPSPEGYAQAQAMIEEIRLTLMAFSALRPDIDDHVQHVLPYVARAWDAWNPQGRSSWRVWALQPVYWQAKRLVFKALNRGLHVPGEDRRKMAAGGAPVRFTSTDYILPGGDVVVNLLPAPPPPDRTIADAAALLRRWLSERLATTHAERAALEVMTRRASGQELSFAEAGRRHGKISRERVRQVYVQLEQDFRDAHPELKELLKEAA